MMQGRSPLKIKPQTESRRESTLPVNGTGSSWHVQNISRSMIDGDLGNAKLQQESPAAREDQLQVYSLFFKQNSEVFFSLSEDSNLSILQIFDIKKS
jgi:hypothetical protein